MSVLGYTAETGEVFEDCLDAVTVHFSGVDGADGGDSVGVGGESPQADAGIAVGSGVAAGVEIDDWGEVDVDADCF